MRLLAGQPDARLAIAMLSKKLLVGHFFFFRFAFGIRAGSGLPPRAMRANRRACMVLRLIGARITSP